jgi:hypothetical protein
MGVLVRGGEAGRGGSRSGCVLSPRVVEAHRLIQVCVSICVCICLY